MFKKREKKENRFWKTFKENAKVRRLSFAASAVLLIVAVVAALMLPATTLTADAIDFEDYITQFTLKRQVNGKGSFVDVDLTQADVQVTKNDKLRFNIIYTLPENTISTLEPTIGYQLPDVFKAVASNSGAVLDQGEIIGSFTISAEGEILITFNDEMIQKNTTGEMPIDGNITFDCNVSDIITEDTALVTIGSWSINLTAGEAKDIKDDLEVTKTGTAIDELNGIIDYTITITSKNGTKDAPKIADAMSGGIQYLSDFTVTNNANGIVVADAEPYFKDPTTNTSNFSYTFDHAFAPNESYTITYRAKSKDPIRGKLETRNRVEGSAVNNDDEDVKHSAQVDITLRNDVLDKTGSLDTDTNIVTWTITVHAQADEDIGGWTLSDMLQGKEYTPTVAVTYNGNHSNDVTLPYTFGHNTGEVTYTFTYTTPYEARIGVEGMRNKAYLRPDGYTGQYPINDEASVGTGHGEYNPLYKTILEDDKHEGFKVVPNAQTNKGAVTIDWHVDIHPDGADLLSGDGYDWVYDDVLQNHQYLTAEQKTELENAIVSAMSAAGFTRGPKTDVVADRGDYYLEFDVVGDATKIPTGTYDNFTIHSYKTLPDDTSIQFNYTSTGEVPDLTKTYYFHNWGKIMQNTPGGGRYSAERKPEAKYSPILQKFDPVPEKDEKEADEEAKFTTHDWYDVDGKLTWDLAVLIPEGTTSTVTVTDELPKGLSTNNIRLRFSGSNTYYDVAWTDDTHTAGTIDLGDSKTVAITVDADNKISMLLSTAMVNAYNTDDLMNFIIIADVDEKPGDGTPPRFENNAYVSVPDPDSQIGEEAVLGTDNQTQELTVDVYHDALIKSFLQDQYDPNLGRIPYHIDINPDGRDLLDGTDTLTLLDTLKYYNHASNPKTVALVSDSVHIYERNTNGTKGTELTNSEYSYTYSTDKVGNDSYDYLTIKIPDEKALIVEYCYYISSEESLAGTNISNSVELTGITSQTVDSGTEIKIDFNSSASGATVNGLTVCKVDSNNYGKMLSGATFKLQEYTTDNGWVDKATVTTGQDGKVRITNLTPGVAYQLIEMLAPANYKKDPVPYGFMLVGGSTIVKPADFNGDMYQKGDTIYRPNVSSLTSVNVEKVWKDSNGNVIEHDGSIQVQLWQKIGTLSENVFLTAEIQHYNVKYHDPVTINYGPQQFARNSMVDFVLSVKKNRPKQYPPSPITLYVGTEAVTVNPYWDPAEDYSDSATVTYTFPVLMNEDIFISGVIGTRDAEYTGNFTVTATPREGPTPIETGHTVTLMNGGTVLIGGEAVSAGTLINPDTVITLSPPATPAGQSFVGWTVVDGNSIPIPVTGNTFTMVNRDVYATANFSDTSFRITKGNGVTAKVNGAAVTMADAGASVSLELDQSTVPPGRSFNGEWVVTQDSTGNEITVTNNQFTMPSGSVTVAPQYDWIDYSVTYSGGSPVDGYHYGDTVILASIEIEGKELVGWTVLDSNSQPVTLEPGGNSFKMPASDVTITPVYKDIHTVTVNESLHGSVSANPNTGIEGTNVILAIEPDVGYSIDTLTVSDGSGNPITVTNGSFTMPDDDVIVNATFKETTEVTLTVQGTYKTSATKTADIPVASYDPSRKVIVPYGDTATITVTYKDWYNPPNPATYDASSVLTVFDGVTTYTAKNVQRTTVVSNKADIILTYEIPMFSDKTVTLTSTQGDWKIPLIQIDGGTGTDDDSSTSSSSSSTTSTSSSSSSSNSSTSSDTGVKWKDNTTIDRVTLTFYDKDCTQYGIAYHCYEELSYPTVQYVAGSTPSSWDGASSVTATDVASNLEQSGKMIDAYDPDTYTIGDTTTKVDQHDNTYKAALPQNLPNNTTYTYRVGGTNSKGEVVYSEPFTFTTRPATTTSADMTFIWTSDSQFGSNGDIGGQFRRVLTAAKNQIPSGDNLDMLLSGGDFTDNGQYLWEAAAQIGKNEDFFASYPLFVASGNHDQKGGSYNTANLVNVNVGDSSGANEGTGSYYSFDYNHVHVIVLNNGNENNDTVSSDMVTWLGRDLAANAANPDTQWTLVMMHKPVFTSIKGTDNITKDAYSGVSSNTRDLLVPLFTQYNVDVVMQAHAHMYSRTKPISDKLGTVADTGWTVQDINGYEITVNPGAPIYTLLGAAGPSSLGNSRVPIADQPDCIAETSQMHEHSYAIWRIEDDTLYVDSYYVDGSGASVCYDSFGIKKDSSYVPPDYYAVNISSSITNGTVTTNKASAPEGATVTLTVTPSSGYELDTLTVDGGTITPTSIGNDKYTFTMPAHAVTVSATFAESQGGGGTNLIKNGDFSTGDFTNWTAGGTNACTVIGQVATIVNGHGTTDSGGLSQAITFIPGHSYTLTCDIKLNVNKYVKLSLDGTNFIDETLGNTDCATTVHYSRTFVATSDMNQVRFTGNDRNFNIDNIVLIDNDVSGEDTTYTVSAATDLTNGSLTVSPTTAAESATVTVTLSPSAGYELDSWNITDGIIPTATGNANVYTFTMPGKDVTVGATFKLIGGEEPTTYTITTNAGSNGSLSVAPVEAEEDETVTVTITPDTGYELDTLTVDGVNVTSSVESNEYTFSMPAHDVTVSATFKQNGGGGTPTELIVNGDFSTSSNWTVNGEATVNDKSSHYAELPKWKTSSISQDISVVSGETYTVTIQYNGEKTGLGIPVTLGGVSIGSLSGAYGSTFTTTYTATTTGPVTLQIGGTSPDGYCHITNVSVIGAASGGGEEPTTYTVTTNAGSNGGLSVDPDEAEENETVTVTITPDTGYELDTLTVDGVNVTSSVVSNEYTFSMPAHDVTVSASFKSSGGGGSTETSLINNSDFTSGNYDNWTLSNKSYSDVFSVSNGALTVGPNSHSKEAYLTASFTESIKGSTTYRLSATASDTTTGVYIRVKLNDSGNPSTVFKLYSTGSVEFTTLSTVDKFGVMIYADPKTNDSNTFDNIVLTEVTTPAAPPEEEAPAAMPDEVPGDDPVDDEPSEDGILYGTYTITRSNGWHLLIEDLPANGVDSSGNLVHYVYYVVEVDVPTGFTATYSANNADGIDGSDENNRTLTITNTASEKEEGYVLPETGGGGNMPIMVTGATLIVICLFGGVVMMRQRRRASG